MSRDSDVFRGQLGGAPLFAVDAAARVFAGISFRVGRADETAASSGVTHLIEHLVMPPASHPDVECNGVVENLFTTCGPRGAQPMSAVSSTTWWIG